MTTYEKIRSKIINDSKEIIFDKYANDVLLFETSYIFNRLFEIEFMLMELNTRHNINIELNYNKTT
jgi:hypothetical protein